MFSSVKESMAKQRDRENEYVVQQILQHGLVWEKLPQFLRYSK